MNIIVRIPKKKVIDKLEGQTRSICVQSVLAKWYCGCFAILLEMELRNVEKRDKTWDEVHTVGFEEGRSATEIYTAIRLMAAAAREWGPELGVITCSLDVKQAFDNLSPENLSLVMKDMKNCSCAGAEAILREQIGGKCDICFQETRISWRPFDKSTKQGGKESPCLFNLMMRNVFRVSQDEWKRMRMGVKIRNSIGRQEEDRISHMIFADNFCLFAESKEQIIKMIEDATEELKKKGLDWKEEEMQLMSRGFCEEIGDIHLENGGKKYVIKEVTTMQAMGALISEEADSMSALNKADKALWMDMIFYKNNGIAEGRKHKRYREVVQSCILHSCESWSWNKEMVDTLHGWESRNLDLMSSRRWAQTGLSLEWFWANQIRKARRRFADGGG